MSNNNRQDLDQIIFSAFRYALGRQTYIVSITVDFIKNNIDLVPDKFKMLMIEEITRGERNEYGYSLGDDYHAKQWLELRQFLKQAKIVLKSYNRNEELV